ncbi:hypothetical protein P9J83_07670 [Clostridium sporogenes]|uniref:Uncharacterized protein n=1 Tax=Clostridium sporogenes TaxID=1509 RepID=A0AAE4FL32_CLOSG|nr:hypothetical protein [Clostridium sporogenes]
MTKTYSNPYISITRIGLKFKFTWENSIIYKLYTMLINENKLSHEIKSSLKKNGALFIHSYNKIYKEVITEIMKDHFTITVNSNMHLSHGKFLYCCNSMNWDILANALF